MRADEIREMGAEDITARIQELEEERFRLKFRSATEPLEEPLEEADCEEVATTVSSEL